MRARHARVYVCVFGRTDGPTDGRPHGPTDGPTGGQTDLYRDAWKHLKRTSSIVPMAKDHNCSASAAAGEDAKCIH